MLALCGFGFCLDRTFIAVLISWILMAGPTWAAVPITPPDPTAVMLAQAVPATSPETSPKSIQPYLDRVIDNITEFTLDNALKFIAAGAP